MDDLILGGKTAVQTVGSVFDREIGDKTDASKKALLKCLADYKTVFAKYANLNEKKYEESSKYVEVLYALIP